MVKRRQSRKARPATAEDYKATAETIERLTREKEKRAYERLTRVFVEASDEKGRKIRNVTEPVAAVSSGRKRGSHSGGIEGLASRGTEAKARLTDAPGALIDRVLLSGEKKRIQSAVAESHQPSNNSPASCIRKENQRTPRRRIPAAVVPTSLIARFCGCNTSDSPSPLCPMKTTRV